MLDPAELLHVARLLLAGGAVANGNLRKASSSAYYAVFHTVLKTAADALVGGAPRESGVYSTLYRGFSHSRIASVCRELIKGSLKPEIKRAMTQSALSEAARSFAWAFIDLQQKRQDADYDPIDWQSDATSMEDLQLAESAIECWHNIDPVQQLDIVALMLISPRR